VLEAENLITVRRGAHGGARVHAPSSAIAARYVGLVLEHRGATLRDVGVAREVIELDAVRRLTARASKADIATLRHRQDELGASDAPSIALGWARNSLTFHELLVELARNDALAVFEQIVNQLITSAQRSYHASHPPGLGDRILQNHVDHGEMVDLIASHDVDAAVAAWQKHLLINTRQLVDGSGNPAVLDLLGAG
jgi:DNA-binding GntR family transcriptional regulator